MTTEILPELDLLDSVGIGFVQISGAGEVRGNAAAAAMLGGDLASLVPPDGVVGAGPVVIHRQAGERWLELRWRQQGAGGGWVAAVLDGTEAARARQEAEEQAAQLRELGALASVGLWVAEVGEGSPPTLQWSPAVCRIHEVPEGTAPSLAEAAGFFAPEVQSLWESALQACLEGGRAWDLELPLVTGAGRRIWVRTVGRAVVRGGRCVRLVGSLQDITEQKRGEAQLGRSLSLARRYEALFESANALIAIADVAGRFVRVNSAWPRVLGHSQEALGGRPFFEWLHPEDRAAVLPALEGLGRMSGETVAFQGRFQAADGQWRWLSWSCAADPMTGHTYTVAHDITEVRHAQEQVRRLAMLAHHTRSAVLITDTRARIEWANHAFEALSGFRLAEVLGQTPGSVLQGPQTDPDTIALMRARIRAGQEFTVEVLNYHRDGSTYWIELEVQPMRDDGGALTGFMGLGVDITARRQAEVELIAARNRAEDMAATAEQASRAKSSFLAMMSHELRTPLNGVLGMAQLLEGTELSARQRAYVQHIRSSSASLLAILNDILDFSKIEAGRLELSAETFGLPALLDEVVALTRPPAAERGLSLRLHLADDLPPRWLGDPLRLRQIILNLAGNAVRFTERGGIELRAGPAAEGGGGGVRFEVRDTGVGISPEARALLFLPFSQVDASATRRFSGTGLGLAICRQLVELMGGRIGVDSVLGEGSCFWFEVPLSPAPIPARPALPPAPAAVPPASLPDPERSLSVLVVEDHRVNQVVATHMLRRLGCRVTLADDGEAGLEILGAERFDLVLMDCQMPRLDGWEATRRQRRREAEQGLPRACIIALTANAMAEDRQRCLEAGMDDYLTKPLGLEALSAALARWCPPERAAG